MKHLSCFPSGCKVPAAFFRLVEMPLTVWRIGAFRSRLLHTLELAKLTRRARP